MNKNTSIVEKLTNKTLEKDISWIPFTSPEIHFFKNPYEYYQHLDKFNSYAAKYDDGVFLLLTFSASLIVEPGIKTELMLVYVLNENTEILSKVQESLFTLRKLIELNNVNSSIRGKLDSFLEE